MDQNPTPKGMMTCREAGRRGGRARFAQIGSAGMAALGRRAIQASLAAYPKGCRERQQWSALGVARKAELMARGRAWEAAEKAKEQDVPITGSVE